MNRVEFGPRPFLAEWGMRMGVGVATIATAAMVVPSAIANVLKKPWPGRDIAGMTCGPHGEVKPIWGPNHPGPLYNHSPVILKNDARNNNPSDCNPLTDDPTGLYSKPTRCHGAKSITEPDGTLLRVDGFTLHGQRTSDNSTRASYVWFKVKVKPNTLDMWIPRVNAEWVTVAQLKKQGVPDLTAKVKDYRLDPQFHC